MVIVHDQLVGNLSGSNGVLIGHININGLQRKLHEVAILLNEVNFDILAITETHLSTEICDSEISIEGYKIYRKDRNNGKDHWGGCLMYISNALNVSESDFGDKIVNIESIWLNVIVNSQKTLVACIYRPPSEKKFLNKWVPILESVCSKRKNMVILGDFNYDLSYSNKTDNAVTNSFAKSLYSFNLVNLIKQPTRITDTSSSLIDLIITTQLFSKSHICLTGCYDPCISNHHLVYTSLNFKKPKRTPKFIEVSKCLDESKLIKDFENVPWQICSIFDDVDDSLWCWEHLYKSIVTKHVTVRKVKVRQNSKPWINGEIRKELNNRHKLLLKARKTSKGSTEWKAYKKLKNKCTNLVRLAEKDYWKEKFNGVSSSKSFWKTVNDFQGKRSNCEIATLKDEQHGIISDDQAKANLLNHHFATVGKRLNGNVSPDHSIQHIYRVTPCINTIDCSYELYEKSFKNSVKEGKAFGADQISAKHLKLIGPQNCGLYEVIKGSINSVKYPSSWKTGKVKCLFKKGSKQDCDNYRPVTLLSIPSKIFENMLSAQIDNHLNQFNLISEHQWGFRPNRSTEYALLHMTEIWQQAIDQGKIVVALFIDFRKAFDCVSHDILKKKLIASGISGNMYSLLSDYLSERNQFTVVNGQKSVSEEVEFGVPQGSLLGPRFFSIDSNDLPDNVDDGETDMFADDSTSFCITGSFEQAFLEIQRVLNQVSKWASLNGFNIHAGKTEIMFMSRKQFIGPYPHFKLNENTISVTSSTKCLGLIIDNKLSWNDQVHKVCKDFRSKVKKLYSMRFMEPGDLKSIYFGGILPSVLYGISVWGNSSSTLMKPIESIHLKAARFIGRIKKNVSDETVLKTCNWKQVSWYYKRRVACLTYNIYNELSPSPLASLVEKRSTTRCTRKNMLIKQPQFKTIRYKTSFRYRASVLWNNLADDIKRKSYETFKLDLTKDVSILNQIQFQTFISGKALDDAYEYY